jgi:hypothetical protein
MPLLPGITSPQLNCFKSELLKKPMMSPPVKDFFNYGTVITYGVGRYNKNFRRLENSLITALYDW